MIFLKIIDKTDAVVKANCGNVKQDKQISIIGKGFLEEKEDQTAKLWMSGQ